MLGAVARQLTRPTLLRNRRVRAEASLPLTRPTRSVLHRLRLVMVVVTLLSLFATDLARPTPGLAKEFDVVGTVDCGIPSGRRCDLDDTLVLLTDSVSGLHELVAIDISWIKKRLPSLDQDDEIELCVQTIPNEEKPRATCVISAKKRDGTINQGGSTGTEQVSESRQDRGRAQDRDDTTVVQRDDTTVVQTRGGISGVVFNQVTGAPIPGATVRLNGFTFVTDVNGRFIRVFDVDPGTYQLEASAPLFFSRTQPVTIQSAGTTEVSLPLQPLPGLLTGVVRSLVTGAPIPGATVTANGFTATTDTGGGYSIAGLPPGTYQVTASAANFISQTLPATIQTSQATVLNFALATVFPNLNFTLVWGTQPPDLDAHLSGPSSAPPARFHAFFLALNPEPYVSHTGDDQDGLGPERIVVTRHPATQQYVAGEYRFWVDNPNAGIGPNYSGSQARVIVNRDAQLLEVFEVTAATGDPNSRLWHVVNVTLDAAGNATVVPVQQFTNGDTLTVLVVPPYGTKPVRR